MPLLALVTTLVLVDLPPPAECSRDSECVLTTFAGCCGACCPAVRAIPKGKDEQAECKTLNCKQPSCAEVKCEPALGVSSLVAACVARQCEAIRKDAQCRVASDCVLFDDAVPGPMKCTKDSCCCPRTVARPRTAAPPARVSRSARCEACVPESFSSADCVEGRCEPVISRPRKR